MRISCISYARNLPHLPSTCRGVVAAAVVAPTAHSFVALSCSEPGRVEYSLQERVEMPLEAACPHAVLRQRAFESCENNSPGEVEALRKPQGLHGLGFSASSLVLREEVAKTERGL